MKRCTFPLLLAIMALVFGTMPLSDVLADNQRSTLEIIVTGFDNANGKARLALINTREAFLAETPDAAYEAYVVNIFDNRVERTVVLPYGRYAIQVIHDENGNGKLDTRMFGIPKERYGFSNNARGTFGPPAYEDAVFTVDTPRSKVEIEVK